MRPDGSHRRRLTDRPGDEFDPSWSPNGRWVVYRDSRRGINNDDEIYIVRADRSGARDVSRNPANEWGPAWSPDGDLIAFNSDRNGWPQIYVMRPDGSRVRRLTDIEGEYPAWSPDGKQIAFMSQDGETGADGAPAYEVYAMDRDGGRQRRITSAPGEDGWPAWSPDGTTIAFSSTRDDTGQLGEDGPLFDIWVMAPDGSGQRRVSERYGQFVTWSPDGRLLVTPGGWLVMPDGSGEMDLPATTRGIAFDFADWLPPGGR